MSVIEEGAEESYTLEVSTLAPNQRLVGIFGVKDDAR